MNIVRCLSLFIILFLSVLILPTTAQSADVKINYLAAIKHVELKEWEKAINLITTIDEFDQQESVQLQNYSPKTPYLPKYYTGLSYFNLGQCREAEINLVSSLAQQIIKNLKSEYSTLLKIRAVCKSRLKNGVYINQLEEISKQLNLKGDELVNELEGLIKLRRSKIGSSIWNKSVHLKNQEKIFRSYISNTNQKITDASFLKFSTKNVNYLKRLIKKIDSHQQEISEHHKESVRYIESLNQLEKANGQIEATFESFFNLRNSKFLSDEWAKSGKLINEFKRHNKNRKTLLEQSKAIFTVQNADELQENVGKAAKIINQLISLEQEVNKLIGFADSKINQGTLRLKEEKKVVYAGVDAFLSGEYQKTLDILLNAEVTETSGIYYKNLFITAAYFYMGEKAAYKKALDYKLKAKKSRLVEDISELYFSPKFIIFYQAK